MPYKYHNMIKDYFKKVIWLFEGAKGMGYQINIVKRLEKGRGAMNIKVKDINTSNINKKNNIRTRILDLVDIIDSNIELTKSELVYLIFGDKKFSSVYINKVINSITEGHKKHLNYKDYFKYDEEKKVLQN